MALSKQKRKELREINKQKLQNVIPSGTKTCTHCHQEKDVSEFNKDYSRKDGLCGWCKECQSIYNQQRKANMIHISVETKICGKCKKEKPLSEFQKDSKNYDGVQSACKQCVSEYTGSRYIEKQEYILKQNEEWRKNNSEQYKQIIKKYHKSDKGKLAEKLHKIKRKEAMSKLPNTFTEEEWQECLKYFNYECVYCRNVEKLQRDHFVSALKGGPFTKENVVCACSICNLRKGDRDFFEWFPKQEFYSKEREEKILKYLGYI